VGPKQSKPAFQAVIDLGLRDVGVANAPRRQAAAFGKMSIRIFPLFVLAAVGSCAIIRATGAGRWIVMPLALVSVAGIVLLAMRMARRSPVVAVKITAEGANQATRLLMAHLALLVLAAVLGGTPLLIPLLLLTLVLAPLVWRGRERVPEVLRELRPLLAADESVMGDGIGRADGARGWKDSFRLVVATDRRLLVVASPRSTGPFVVVDAPYDRVSRFGIEWKYAGRIGTLSLTLAGAGGAPPEAHAITSVAPANLLSIALALTSHGVHADDPTVVADAEREWEDARGRRGPRGGEPPRREPRRRLLDRAPMNTPEFDHGLWLLLGLSAVALYVNPFGVGIGAARNAGAAVLVFVPAVCAICGYVSGTRSSLAYLAPLNLLVSPAFFFWDASYVISLMILLSAFAAAALWAGSALRGETGDPESAPAGATPEPGTRAARGSLRYTLGGFGLIRISVIMLVAMAALVATASAAGFELTSLRLAIDEATGHQVPVDGRSNLTGNAASLTYTPGPDLHGFITDNPDDGPTDGARWELRSSFTKGLNVVSLASYIEEPRLDNAAAIANFVADKDAEHAGLAGFTVTHTERVVDGHRGYVWSHGSRRGYWYYAAWFPRPGNSVRVECIARNQRDRFKRLCAEAVGSLKFH
jgi:hypothetical protein